VVTESALDALSVYQCDPQPGLYLSFAGTLSPDQRQLLAQVLTRYPAASVLAATDNDAEGEAFAALIQSFRPDARRARSPQGKDWNDMLRSA
jgi:DNA primase